MRWLEDHGGWGPWLPLTHLLTPLSLKVQQDFQATAGHHPRPQHVLIPALTIRQGLAVHMFVAAWWKADATWLSQIG